MQKATKFLRFFGNQFRESECFFDANRRFVTFFLVKAYSGKSCLPVLYQFIIRTRFRGVFL